MPSKRRIQSAGILLAVLKQGKSTIGRRLGQALLAAVVVWLPQAPPPSVGFVLSQRGPWQVNGQAIKQGQGLPRGAHVVLATTATFGAGETYSIDVILLNNKDVSLQCAAREICGQGLVLPSSLNAESSLASRFADVFQLILAKPERFVGLMSRDVTTNDESSFTEGVGRLVNGRVELAPFFASLPDGRYRLKLERVDSSGAPSSPVNIDISWNHTAPSVASASIEPGLYRATLTRPADVTVPAREIWLLARPDPKFAAAKSAFDQATQSVKTWPATVPRRDVTTFLRAYLTSIANQPQ